MAMGTVKWFNPTKGYGFIQQDTGGKDVFVHISAVEKAGYTGLAEGAKVTFDVVPNRGKESAENLKNPLSGRSGRRSWRNHVVGYGSAAAVGPLAWSKTEFRLLEPNDLRLLKNFMNVGWNDLNRVQEPGQYPFRDGTIFITFAEIATWKQKPDAEFQLMRKHPIQSQIAYVLGKQV
jgi:CspA family cold shock protein